MSMGLALRLLPALEEDETSQSLELLGLLDDAMPSEKLCLKETQ